MAGDKEQIDVTVDLNDNLSRPARTAAESVDDLGDNAKQTERRLKALQRQADSTGRSLEYMAIKNKAAAKSFKDQDERVSFMADELSKVEKKTKKQTDATKNLNKETDKSNKGFKAFQRTIGRVGKTLSPIPKQLTSIAKGLGAVWVVAAGGAAVQNVLSMVSALTSLVSLAAFIPTAIGALIAIFGTLAVATKGVSTELGTLANGKLDKTAAGFKNLSPAAQDFVSDVADMVPALKKVQKSVQNDFFKPFAVLVKPFLQSVIGPISKGMGDIATSLGYATGEVILFFRSAAGLTLIKNIFKAGADAVKGLSQAVGPVLHGLSSVTSVVSPYWKKFLDIVGQLGAKFGRWMDEISRSGQLKEWIDTALGVMKQLWSVVKNVFGIVKGLIDTVGDGKGLAPLVTALATVNKWVNSDVGSSALQGFFASLGKLLPALTPALLIVANAIGKILAPAIANIVTALAPGFTVFLQALSDGLALIAPVVGPLAGVLGQLLIALSPLLKPLGLLISYAGTILVQAFKILNPIIGALASTIGTLLTPFLNTAIKVFQIASPYISVFGQILTNVFASAAPLIELIGKLFSLYLNKYLNELSTKILPQLLPLLILLGIAIGQFLQKALAEIIPLIPTIADVMTKLMLRSAEMAPILLKLAIGFIQLATKMLPFIGVGIKIVSVIFTIIGAFISAGIRIEKFVSTALSAIGKVPGVIRSAFSTVVDAISSPFTKAYDKIVGIIDKMKSAISNFKPGDLIAGAISTIENLNPFRFAGGPVEAGQNYTVGEIGKEMYVPKTGGTPQIIGENGMETKSFAGDGMILPNYMLNAMESNAAMMRKHAAAQEKMSMPTMGRGQNHTHFHNHEGDKLDATFTGDIHGDVDIERAMRRFHKQMKREESERR